MSAGGSNEEESQLMYRCLVLYFRSCSPIQLGSDTGVNALHDGRGDSLRSNAERCLEYPNSPCLAPQLYLVPDSDCGLFGREVIPTLDCPLYL